MHQYCSNDVTILRKAAVTFRKLLLETCGVDPFQYATIASVCMGVYKSCFYPEIWEGITQAEQLTAAEEGRPPVKTMFATLGGQAYRDGEPFQELMVRKDFVRAPLAQSDHSPSDNFSAKSIHWLR